MRDPQSDLSRIVRQQTLMSEALDQVVREVDNPVRLRELIEIGTANVSIDSDLTLRDVRTLADRFGDLGSDSFHTMSLPVVPRPGDEALDRGRRRAGRGADPRPLPGSRSRPCPPGGRRGHRAQRDGDRSRPAARGSGG